LFPAFYFCLLKEEDEQNENIRLFLLCNWIFERNVIYEMFAKCQVEGWRAGFLW
jgi:hypothetical protein